MTSCLIPRLPYAFGCWTCILTAGALGSIGVYFVNSAAGIAGITGFGISAICLGAATCVSRSYAASLADAREIQSYAGINAELKEGTGNIELVVSKLTPDLQALGKLVAELKSNNTQLRAEIQEFEKQKQTSILEKAALEKTLAEEKLISGQMRIATQELQNATTERKTDLNTEAEQLKSSAIEIAALKTSEAQLKIKAEALEAQVKKIETLAAAWRQERDKIAALVTNFSQDTDSFSSLQTSLNQTLESHDASWEAQMREFRTLLSEEQAATLQQRINFNSTVIEPLKIEIADLAKLSDAFHQHEEATAHQNQESEQIQTHDLELQNKAVEQLAAGAHLLHPTITV